MKLHALLFVGLVLAACGPSTTDVCSQFAAVYCQQQYTCKTGADLQALQTKYGADVATCSKTYAQLNCNAAQPCPAGKSYDTGREQTCTTEYQGLTCDEINQNKDPSQTSGVDDCDVFNYICH
jgi:hypothetical protein